MADWYGVTDGVAQARLAAAWAGAPIENAELCGMLLDTAKMHVLAFASEPSEISAALSKVLLQFGRQDRLQDVLTLLELDDTEPPFNYVFAQLQQAKNLWAAGRADENGEIGTEGYSFTPRPLDKTIRALIRPVQGDIHVL